MSEEPKLIANRGVPAGEIRSPAGWLDANSVKEGGYVRITHADDKAHLRVAKNDSGVATDHLVAPGTLGLTHLGEIGAGAFEISPASVARYRAARAFGTPQGRAELVALVSGVSAGLIFASLRLGAAGYVYFDLSERWIFWLYVVVGLLGATSPIASYLAGKWLAK